MRPPATIHRRHAAPRRRGRFHTVALLVLFSALAWLADTEQAVPPVGHGDDAAAALQDGCRRPSPGSSQSGPAGPCALPVASLPAR